MPFNPALTQPAKFKNADGTQSDVAMMEAKLPVRHLYKRYGPSERSRDNLWQAVELPYGKAGSLAAGLISSVFILPPQGQEVKIETAEPILHDTLALPIKGETHFCLPRSSLDVEIDPLPAFAHMGMRDALDPISANFSGMFNEAAYISKGVLRINWLNNEAGSEMSSAGAIEVTRSSPPEFDRPFLQYIVVRRAGETPLILAAAAVRDLSGSAIDPQEISALQEANKKFLAESKKTRRRY